MRCRCLIYLALMGYASGSDSWMHPYFSASKSNPRRKRGPVNELLLCDLGTCRHRSKSIEGGRVVMLRRFVVCAISALGELWENREFRPAQVNVKMSRYPILKALIERT